LKKNFAISANTMNVPKPMNSNWTVWSPNRSILSLNASSNGMSVSPLLFAFRDVDVEVAVDATVVDNDLDVDTDDNDDGAKHEEEDLETWFFTFDIIDVDVDVVNVFIRWNGKDVTCGATKAVTKMVPCC
jgi:hypothetical protein